MTLPFTVSYRQKNIIWYDMILGSKSPKFKKLSRGWQPSAQSSLWFWFRNCFSALRPEIKHFRIHKKCYFPVKCVVSLISFVMDCSLYIPSMNHSTHLLISRLAQSTTQKVPFSHYSFDEFQYTENFL